MSLLGESLFDERRDERVRHSSSRDDVSLPSRDLVIDQSANMGFRDVTDVNEPLQHRESSSVLRCTGRRKN